VLGGAFAVALGLLAPALEGGPPPEVTVRHHVRAHESLDRIAAEYGVTKAQLLAWNKLAKGAEVGRTLLVQPKVFPRPRQLRKVEVGEDDDWDSIASRYAVTVDDVRGWNARLGKRKRPPRKATLALWLPSGVEHPLPPMSQPLPEIDVRGGGVSVGRPNRGRLRNGVPLPHSEHYKVRVPYQGYGTSLTVRDVQRAIAGFRSETGFDDPIVIGALSRRTGRRLRPHKSHQSGRDVDVRLPAMPFTEGHTLESHEVDWHAAYALIDAFVRTGDVGVIFLERKFYRRLRRAAERLGADDERISHVLGHLRHAKGHTGHFHVRFRCAPDAMECKD
jgi:murein endopeptidase